MLADMILQLADRKPLNEELRQRIASRAAALKVEAMVPYYGSLQKDPSHQSAYFLAVDGIRGEPLLLRFAPASSPASALFPQSILIGRMRPGARELVVNAVPFGPEDGAAIRRYVEQVDAALLPRPQGPQVSIAVGTSKPEIDLPSAFAAYRSIQKKAGINVASVVVKARHAEQVRTFFEATLWAAIRSGWREGYNLGVEVNADGHHNAQAIIREAAGYSRFVIDVSQLEEATLSEEDGAWCLNEFSRTFSTGDASYELTSDEILRLATKFHRKLLRAEELHDSIRLMKAQHRAGRTFDFELAVNAQNAEELLFCLHWMKARGRAPQMVRAATMTPEMAGVARFFSATVDADENSELDGAGRWNCTVNGADRIVDCWERMRAG